MKPDFTQPAPDFVQEIKRLTDKIVSGQVIAKAIVDGRKKERTMSVLDKLDLVVARRDDFNVGLADRADKLLERYANADKKADRAFGKHHTQLDAEEDRLDKTEAAIDRLSNMGNSEGSETSSEQQKNGG